MHCSCMLRDGVLSAKEKIWIENVSRAGGVTNDDDMKQILKGNDMSKELETQLYKLFNHFYSKTKTKKEIDAKAYGAKINTILFGILAASQDGFVRDEYKTVTKIALLSSTRLQVIKKTLLFKCDKHYL